MIGQYVKHRYFIDSGIGLVVSTDTTNHRVLTVYWLKWTWNNGDRFRRHEGSNLAVMYE